MKTKFSICCSAPMLDSVCPVCKRDTTPVYTVACIHCTKLSYNKTGAVCTAKPLESMQMNFPHRAVECTEFELDSLPF